MLIQLLLQLICETLHCASLYMYKIPIEEWGKNKKLILIHSGAKNKNFLRVNKEIKSVVKVGVKGYNHVLVPFFDPDENNLSYIPPKIEGVLYIVSQKVLSVCNREDFVITINQMLLGKGKKLIKGFRSYVD